MMCNLNNSYDTPMPVLFTSGPRRPQYFYFVKFSILLLVMVCVTIEFVDATMDFLRLEKVYEGDQCPSDPMDQKTARRSQVWLVALTVASFLVCLFGFGSILKEICLFCFMFAFVLMVIIVLKLLFVDLEVVTIVSTTFLGVLSSLSFFFGFILRNDRIMYTSI